MPQSRPAGPQAPVREVLDAIDETADVADEVVKWGEFMTIEWGDDLQVHLDDAIARAIEEKRDALANLDASHTPLTKLLGDLRNDTQFLQTATTAIGAYL